MGAVTEYISSGTLYSARACLCPHSQFASSHPSRLGMHSWGLPSLRFVESYSEFNTMMSVGGFVRDRLGGNLTWDLAARIIDHWDGPVVIKGILHPDDAHKAVELGFDGIVVSNHGGRQFDGGPAPIDALPDIVSAVKGKTSIIMDSGLRSGLAMIVAPKFLALAWSFLLW